MILAIAALLVAGVALLLVALQEWRIREHDVQAYKERLFLLESAQTERHELTTKLMSRDLNDYRMTVATEAKAEHYDDPEKRRMEQYMDSAYGPEWRVEV